MRIALPLALIGVIGVACAEPPTKKESPPKSEAVGKELTDSETPNAEVVSTLVADLKQRDAVIREAAIRRLLTCPEVAANPVVELFATAQLQARLACLELLHHWKAPVEGLDPWQPETITAARVQAVKTWASKVAAPSAAQSALTAEQLTEARREIGRMLAAKDDEAGVIRERLATHRRLLLPEVYAQLKDAATDQARERLTALRYRLVASDALALEWRGGIERLAATAETTRQQAANEFAKRATAADRDLLLELFSNPDPQVREVSLRALNGLADPGTATALANLLRDPSPNVRATVLKQLAEKPVEALIPKIVEYVGKEKDADLVVYAVRVLKGSSGKSAVACLIDLLKHENWRVRAESAEGLGKLVSDRYSSGIGRESEQRADICAALIETLKDTDGFVVSRAVEGLSQTDLAVAVEPLAAAAAKHPELTESIVNTLVRGQNMRAKAVVQLKKFAAHELPEVRAAAITGLCSAAPEEVEPFLKSGLRDPQSRVRTAAAEGFFSILITYRTSSAPSGVNDVEATNTWLQEFSQGKHRKSWFASMLELVTPLTTAKDAEERTAACLCAIALGQDEKAIPIMLQAIASDAELQAKAAAALPWLPWTKRVALYQRFVKLNPTGRPLAAIVHAMSEYPDKRAEEPLWALAARPDLSGLVAAALQQAFSGERHSYIRAPDPTEQPSEETKETIKRLKSRIDTGPEAQRIIALVSLVHYSPKDAAEVAAQIVDDPKSTPELRRDALQVQLTCQASGKSQESLAVAALAKSKPELYKVAFGFLTGGHNYYQQIHWDEVYIYSVAQNYGYQSTSGGTAITPAAPEGMKAEVLRPLLRNSDPVVAATAAYFLTLMHEPGGFDILLRYWKQNAQTSDEWTRLVFRAAACTNDDANVPLLDEIYHALVSREQNLSEFYWTIRIMEGPQALALRKRIRQEVGMENLR